MMKFPKYKIEFLVKNIDQWEVSCYTYANIKNWSEYNIQYFNPSNFGNFNVVNYYLFEFKAIPNINTKNRILALNKTYIIKKIIYSNAHIIKIIGFEIC